MPVTNPKKNRVIKFLLYLAIGFLCAFLYNLYKTKT